MKKLIVDGALVEAGSIEVGVGSRGLAYGYGVFETIKIQDGQPCFFAEHYQRLDRAARGIGLKLAYPQDELREQSQALIRSNGVSEGVYKIIVFEDATASKVVLFVRTVGRVENASAIRVLASPVVKASQAFTSRHKTLNYLETARELEAARSRGFDECLYCNEFGFLTECSISNLFFVAEGVVKTPRLDCGLLDGIIRAQVLEVAESNGMRIEEGSYSMEELLEAEEAFVTNSAVGLIPIREIDDGAGRQKMFDSRLAGRLRAAFLEVERARRG